MTNFSFSLSQQWINGLFMVTTFLLMVGVLLLSFKTPPQTVVFNIEQTLDSYQNKLIEAKLSDDEHRKQLAAFDAALRQFLYDYAAQHHLVIVVPGAAIAGAPDMTTALQHQLIQRMKDKT